MAETTAPKATAKKAKAVHLVVAPNGDVFVQTNENIALRQAITLGGYTEPVEIGKSINVKPVADKPGF